MRSKIRVKLISLVTLLSFGAIPAQSEVLERNLTHLMPQSYPPIKEWSDVAKRGKGIVIIIHGLSQRSESVVLLAKAIADGGYDVLAIDQRGHGEWHDAGSKGKPGFFCDFKKTSEDLAELVVALKTKRPSYPVFLLGESIGASVALKAASLAQDKVDGVVACSCGAKATRFKASWILHDIIHSILKPFSEISVRKYQQEYACENPSVLAVSLKDNKARAGFRPIEIVRINRFFAHNKKYAQALSPQTDLLLLSGDLDRLTAPEQCAKLLKAAQSRRKSLSTISGSGHMMIGRPDVFPQTKTTVSQWLDNECVRMLAQKKSVSTE